jgi:hypothetical protein
MAEQICQPNGLMFDKHGNPRERYVRVGLSGTSRVIEQSDADAFLCIHGEGGDDVNYTTEDVYLSRQEFDELTEFTGF